MTTGEDGRFCFEHLGPGVHSIREVIQEGWEQTSPGGAHEVPTESGKDVRNLDFANFKQIRLCGTKFDDLLANQVRDSSDPGLANWEIRLDLDSNDSIDRTAITAAEGGYCFEDIGPGDHRISEVLIEGWRQTFPAGPGTHSIEARSGRDFLDLDFGNFRLGLIAGIKFEDRNADGLWQDPGEARLPGWTIYLDVDEDGQLDRPGQSNVCDELSGEPCAVTDARGEYAFGGLLPGAYPIREVVQPGWVQTNPDPLLIVVDRSGQVFPAQNIGNFELAKIRGIKFDDLDEDGRQDSNEPGLAEWMIFLDGNDNERLDDSERFTLTDFEGRFEFDNLGPGRYVVREVQQTGWVQTSPDGQERTWFVSNSGSFENATGSSVGLDQADDQVSREELSFQFPFLSNNFGELYISSNGFLWLGSSGGPQAQVSAARLVGGVGLIAPFWTDLDPAQAGTVLLNDQADRAIVTWQGVASHSGGSDRHTFQTQLHESGEIRFCYADITLPHRFPNPVLIGIGSGEGVLPEQTDFSDAPFDSAGERTIWELVNPLNGQFDLPNRCLTFTPPPAQPGAHIVNLESGQVFDGAHFGNSKGGPTALTVNSTGDQMDSRIADGVCDTGETLSNGDAKCTLRAAIQQANANQGTDTILFDIPGAAPHSIRLQSQLPTIDDPVTIDGSSQTGFSGTPVIELDGASSSVGP